MERRYFAWIVLAILIAFPFGANILYSSFVARPNIHLQSSLSAS
jgi:hypothetical protein